VGSGTEFDTIFSFADKDKNVEGRTPQNELRIKKISLGPTFIKEKY
jgi:hypothetical protein